MEKTDERIAHKIARDLEKAENKRKEREEGSKALDPEQEEAEVGAEEESQSKKRRQEEKDHAEARGSGGGEIPMAAPIGGASGATDLGTNERGERKGKRKIKETGTKAKRRSTTQGWTSMP